MEISHVIRGEDHLSNTPKHILLFRALGYPSPALRPPAAHPQPGPDEDEQAQEPDRGRRLHRRRASSARRSSTTSRSSAGRPAPRRRSSRSTRSSSASTSTQVHKGGAVFDRERLEWLNGQWIRRLDPDDLVDRLRPFLEADLAAGRIDRMPVRRRAPRRCCRSSGSACRRSAPIGDLVGFLWVDEVDARPGDCSCPKRWDAATTLRRAWPPRATSIAGRRAR